MRRVFKILLGSSLLIVAIAIAALALWTVHNYNTARDVIKSSKIDHRLRLVDNSIDLTTLEQTVLEIEYGDSLYDKPIFCDPLDRYIKGKQPSVAYRVASDLALDVEAIGTLEYQKVRFFSGCRLSREYPKQVLLRYKMETVYLGQGEYGVTKAAMTIFGKLPQDLDKNEAIEIAVLFRNPNLRNNPEKWHGYRDKWLKNSNEK